MIDLKQKFYLHVQNKNNFKNITSWYKNTDNIDLNEFRTFIDAAEYMHSIRFNEFLPDKNSCTKDELIKHINDLFEKYDECYTFEIFYDNTISVYKNKIVQESDEQVIKKLSKWYSEKIKENRQYELFKT